jgi:DNA polymerase-1
MEFDHIIVDGNYMARRLFSVHKHLSSTLDGKTYYTGLTHGFFLQLCALKREYDGKITIVWDRGIKRRRLIDRNYKRSRREKGKDWEDKQLYSKHLEVLERFLKFVGIRQAYKDGEEGDDIIKTLVEMAEGKKVLVVSNDHDMYQLIDENTSLLVNKKRGVKLLTLRRFKREFLVDPEAYLYAMAIAGCKGDGVDGVEGVGMKTALDFTQKWPTLVPTLIGTWQGNQVLDWFPRVDKKNKVVEETPFFKVGVKGPSKRLRSVIENGNVVAKTYRLVQLYNVWPLTFIIPKSRPGYESLLDNLELLEMHELASRVDQIRELYR